MMRGRRDPAHTINACLYAVDSVADMADEMDPCECLWNHELAMRRLISLLRQGQSYCTDTDCLETMPNLPQPESSANSFMVMFLMMALALAMYAMRPRRNQIQDAAKPSRNSQDHDGAPPTPPRI
ncbi:hypothetical protein PYW08_004043 [Mythimna loreyi]|uniref:Uncharacterized protein n=1 Tax=Mythimna loreyi TaxID=667449 RepID=A0ACC2QWA1_9NEOP|nr:hypothetical protein PYW08_004043 [Mythimna loreyi]